MSYVLFFVALIVLFVVSWLHAVSSGRSKSLGKELGGITRFNSSAGYVVAIIGFTAVYLSLLFLVLPAIVEGFSEEPSSVDLGTHASDTIAGLWPVLGVAALLAGGFWLWTAFSAWRANQAIRREAAQPVTAGSNAGRYYYPYRPSAFFFVPVRAPMRPRYVGSGGFGGGYGPSGMGGSFGPGAAYGASGFGGGFGPGAGRGGVAGGFGGPSGMSGSYGGGGTMGGGFGGGYGGAARSGTSGSFGGSSKKSSSKRDGNSSSEAGAAIIVIAAALGGFFTARGVRNSAAKKVEKLQLELASDRKATDYLRKLDAGQDRTFETDADSQREFEGAAADANNQWVQQYDADDLSDFERKIED